MLSFNPLGIASICRVFIGVQQGVNHREVGELGLIGNVKEERIFPCLTWVCVPDTPGLEQKVCFSKYSNGMMMM